MEVPRAWLPAIAGGVLVLLLVVVYLLGKEAGRQSREDGQPPATAAGGDVETAPPTSPVTAPAPPAAPAEVPGIAYQPPTPLNPSLEAPPSFTGGGSIPGSNPVPSVNPRSAAVAAYFTEIEGYERQAKSWSNPQELAMSLVAQGAQGDTSGLRQLLDAQRTAQGQIESMAVPPECQEHHRQTLDVLRRAGELLQELERGMSSGNLEGLLALSGRARQLESETREVDALARELKSRYGIAGA